ncbi:MAG: biotin--[acetyl-CoA-carboxylase] ligase, partial [Bacteroidales bacterium]|jgi:BirA family biotin operon repressor/biotin-[acetyl-CoA-carboxylase] ligase|nr:biotin--[acetyl-CoA-carboxylase] ligase [Bacteroidales bacterium]
MKYIYRFSVLSTNVSASRYNFAENFIIYTYRQTAGRGMGTNSWFTGHGNNIALSLCLKPVFLKPEEQFLLNMVLSNALRNALQTLVCGSVVADVANVIDVTDATDVTDVADFNASTGAYAPQVFLKWPNDIYIGDKKLAGILFENKISGGSGESNCGEFYKSIIGIGLNVNQKKFPASLPNPTSLRIAAKRKFCKKKIVHILGSALENACNNLAVNIAKNGYKYVWDECKKEYLSALLYYGVERNFIYKNTLITGKIVDIDNFGRLVISTKDSIPVICDIKEVKFSENF